MKQVPISMAKGALPLPTLAFVGGGADVAESRELDQQLSVKPKAMAPEPKEPSPEAHIADAAPQGGLLLGSQPGPDRAAKLGSAVSAKEGPS